MKARTIYRFGVTLHAGPGDLGENKPHAQILIVSSNSLSTLAQAILKAFKFNYDHPYGFYSSLHNPFNAKEMYELFTETEDIEPTEGALGVTYTRLSKVFTSVGKEMLFLFDYGDYWQFKITLEYTFEDQPNQVIKYPVVLKTAGKLPKQYTPIKEEAWEFDDDCPLCQELKKSGAKLQWYPDEPNLQKRKQPN